MSHLSKMNTKFTGSIAVTLAELLFSLCITHPVRSACPPVPPHMPAVTVSQGATDRDLNTSSAVKNTGNNASWRTVRVFEGKGNACTPPFAVSGTRWSLNWKLESEADRDITFRVHIFHRDKPYALWQTVSCTHSGEGEKILPVGSEDGEEYFLKIFASNLVSWTITVQDNLPEVPSSAVEITYIHYYGTRYPRDTENCICYELVEPDEYVVITNTGKGAQRMGGWTLKNITKGYPTFTFPQDFVLQPGESVLVTTNQVYPGCGAWLEFGTSSPYCSQQLWFSFYFGPGDTWDNTTPDTAVLYDSDRREVSRKSYTVFGH